MDRRRKSREQRRYFRARQTYLVDQRTPSGEGERRAGSSESGTTFDCKTIVRTAQQKTNDKQRVACRHKFDKFTRPVQKNGGKITVEGRKLKMHVQM